MGVLKPQSLTSDPSGQVHIFALDSDSVGVKAAEVDVLKEADHIRLGRLLESEQG